VPSGFTAGKDFERDSRRKRGLQNGGIHGVGLD